MLIGIRVRFTCRILKWYRGNGRVWKGDPLCLIEYYMERGRTEDVVSHDTGYLRIEPWMEEEKDWISAGTTIATIETDVPI